MIATNCYKNGDRVVPEYVLEKRLGAGGFGEVWQARGPGNLLRAIKIVNLADTVTGRKEFRALQLVKNRKHPHLVPILGIWLKDRSGQLLPFFESEPPRTLTVDASPAASPAAPASARESTDIQRARETRAFAGAHALTSDTDAPTGPGSEPSLPGGVEPAELIIAMELGEMNLLEHMHACQESGEAGIPADTLLRFLQSAAEAIDRLNREGIQHCDIKPQNILIVDNDVWVCDFGLAQATGTDAQTSGDHALSLAYAAPELIDGKQPNGRTDLYCLAVTYVELRTGHLPFPTDSVASLVQAKKNSEFQFVGLTFEEETVLRRALQADPDARDFDSNQQFLEKLRNAYQISQLDEVDDPEQLPSPVPAWIYLAVGLLALTAIIITVTRTWSASPDTALANRIDDLVATGKFELAAELTREIASEEARQAVAAQVVRAWLTKLSDATTTSQDPQATIEELHRLIHLFPESDYPESRFPEIRAARELRGELLARQRAALFQTHAAGDITGTIERAKLTLQAFGKVPGEDQLDHFARTWLVLLDARRELLNESWAKSDLADLAASQANTGATTSSSPFVLLLRYSLAQDKVDANLATVRNLNDIALIASATRDMTAWERLAFERIVERMIEHVSRQGGIRAMGGDRASLIRRIVGDNAWSLDLADVRAAVAGDDLGLANQILDDLADARLSDRGRQQIVIHRQLVRIWDLDQSLADKTAGLLTLGATSPDDCARLIPAIDRTLERTAFASSDDLPAESLQAFCEAAIALGISSPSLQAVWLECVAGQVLGKKLDGSLEQQVRESLAALPHAGSHQTYQMVVAAFAHAACLNDLSTASELLGRLLDDRDDWQSVLNASRRRSAAQVLVEHAESLATVSANPLKPAYTPEAAGRARADLQRASQLLSTTTAAGASADPLVLRLRAVETLAVHSDSNDGDRMDTILQQLHYLADTNIWDDDSALLPWRTQLHFVRADALYAAATRTAKSLSASDRLACLQSYAIVADALYAPKHSTSIAANVNGADAYDSVIRPATTLYSDNQAKRLSQGDRGRLAKLHWLRARLIETDHHVASKVTGDRNEQAYQAYDLAATLDARADYLVSAALAYRNWRQSEDLDAVARRFEQAAKDSLRREPNHVGAQGLQSCALLLRSRLVSDPTEKSRLLDAAMASFDSVLEREPDNVTHLINRSSANVEMAFLQDKGSVEGRTDAEVRLRQAVTDAKKARELAQEPLEIIYAQMALGHAYEDLAHYLGATAEFENSQEALKHASRQALNDLRRVQQCEAELARGRCRIRLAMSRSGSAAKASELAVARTILQQLHSMLRTARSTAERKMATRCHYWLAYTETRLLELSTAEIAASVNTAAGHFEEAIKLGKKLGDDHLPEYQAMYAEFCLANQIDIEKGLTVLGHAVGSARTLAQIRLIDQITYDTITLPNADPEQIQRVLAWVSDQIQWNEASDERDVQLRAELEARLRTTRLEQLAKLLGLSAQQVALLAQDQRALPRLLDRVNDKTLAARSEYALGRILLNEDFDQGVVHLVQACRLFGEVYEAALRQTSKSGNSREQGAQSLPPGYLVATGYFAYVVTLKPSPSSRQQIKFARQHIERIRKSYPNREAEPYRWVQRAAGELDRFERGLEISVP